MNIDGPQPIPNVYPLKSNNKVVPWEPYKGAVQKQRSNVQNQDLGSSEKVAYEITSITRKPCKKRLKNVPPLTIALNEDNVCDDSAVPPSDPVLTSTDALHRIATIMSSPASSIVDGIYPNEEQTNLQRKIYELQLFCEKLTIEKDSLNDQLQIQSKVNGELKKLLVASMGDDLQLHLNGLSQDKVRLAQDVVHYTEQLSEGRDNIENLSIDRDIWRSKYLASSVMADELIGWRLFLIRQFEQAQTCLWHMLNERESFKTKLYATFLNHTEILQMLSSNGEAPLSERSIEAIVNCVKEQSTIIKQKISGDNYCRDLSPLSRCPLSDLTEAEKASKRILEIDSTGFYATTPCNDHEREKARQTKMMGFPLNSNFKNLTVNCCGQCYGQIQCI